MTCVCLFAVHVDRIGHFIFIHTSRNCAASLPSPCREVYHFVCNFLPHGRKWTKLSEFVDERPISILSKFCVRWSSKGRGTSDFWLLAPLPYVWDTSDIELKANEVVETVPIFTRRVYQPTNGLNTSMGSIQFSRISRNYNFAFL